MPVMIDKAQEHTTFTEILPSPVTQSLHPHPETNPLADSRNNNFSIPLFPHSLLEVNLPVIIMDHSQRRHPPPPTSS